DVAGAAAVGPEDHVDLLVGQLRVLVGRLDLLVAPPRDLAAVDAGQDFRGEVEVLDAFQVVDRHDGAHDERDVQHRVLAAGLLDLVVAHGRVGAAEVGQAVDHAGDAGAGAFAGVVDLDAL